MRKSSQSFRVVTSCNVRQAYHIKGRKTKPRRAAAPPPAPILQHESIPRCVDEDSPSEGIVLCSFIAHSVRFRQHTHQYFVVLIKNCRRHTIISFVCTDDLTSKVMHGLRVLSFELCRQVVGTYASSKPYGPPAAEKYVMPTSWNTLRDGNATSVPCQSATSSSRTD